MCAVKRGCFCTCNPFVNQGLCEVGTQSVSVGLCNNGCVVMFARLIYSNTLTAILKLCYPEKQQLHEHYIVWPKPLNVKVNIGSLQHCRHEMVILCCVCVFVCICLSFAWIHFILQWPSVVTTLLSKLLLCCSLFSAPTLSFPLSYTGTSNITN